MMERTFCKRVALAPKVASAVIAARAHRRYGSML